MAIAPVLKTGVRKDFEVRILGSPHDGTYANTSSFSRRDSDGGILALH